MQHPLCSSIISDAYPEAGRRAALGTYNLFLPERFDLPEEVAILFRSIGEHLGMALAQRL